jgi:hypothetical protein
MEHHSTIARGYKISNLRGVVGILITTSKGRDQRGGEYQTTPPSIGSHQMMELCYLNYLEALAVAWQRFYKQESRSSATSMLM